MSFIKKSTFVLFCFRRENTFFYLFKNELITCYQQAIRRVLTIFYLKHLQFCGCLWLGRKHTYHQHKDETHFLIKIEEGHKYVLKTRKIPE